MDNKELREKIHKYFTTLIQYQYEVNHGTDGATRAFKIEQEYQDNQLLEAIKQQKTQMIESVQEEASKVVGVWDLKDFINSLEKIKNQL